ncbi:MAG: hypothetical protein ABSH06_14635 [Thermodesulfobacteriota bacterium]
MKNRRKKNNRLLAYQAKEVFKEAVAEAIAEHRRNEVPIAIFRDEKVIRIPADEIMVRDSQDEYTVSKK